MFTYVLLTGDIAFMASKKEYELFWKTFIKGIYDFHDQNKKEYPTILTIPGNHDISWTQDEIFTNFLTELQNRDNQNKNTFLKTPKNKEKFYQCFQNYSNQFGEDKGKHDPIWDNLFDLEQPQLEICKDYNRYRLYGYVKDSKNKIVFILINSAWFSIGGKFNKLLAQLKAKNLKNKVTEEVFYKILEEKDSVSEYGNQIIGGELFDKKKLYEVLGLSESYSIFTFCHHNLNWIDPAELYNYNEGVMNRLCLNKILKHTDVFGTGHEHVPVNAPIYNVANGYVHLQTGKFMDDCIQKPVGVPVLENCWMSILELKCSKNIHTISQQKFSYQKDIWHPHDIETIRQRPKKGALSEKDVDKVSQILKQLPPDKIVDLLDLKAKYNCEGHVAELGGSENYRMFSLLVQDCTRIILLPLNKNAIAEIFPETINRHYFLLQNIDQFHKPAKAVSQVIKINLVWNDLFVDQSLTTGYYISKNNYDELISEIAQQCDFKLQLFLHKFESLPEVNQLEQNGIFLQFNNTVLPAHYLLGSLNRYMYESKK